MAEKNQGLAEWAQSVKWDKYVYDKEVQVLISQLKDRIESLTASNEASGGDSKQHRVKLVAVGDGAVGKTSLLISYAKGEFPEEYVPTVFENYTRQMKRSDGTQVLLHLWDTAGQEDFDRLRPLSYPGADIVLLCFSTVTSSSLESVKEKWTPEINHYVPDVPYFLIGTKVDLREAKLPDPGTKEFAPVSTEEGEALRKSIKAVKYIEVSSKTRHNLEKVFDDAVDIVLRARAQYETADNAPSSGGSSGSSSANNAAPVDNLPKRKARNGCLLL